MLGIGGENYESSQDYGNVEIMGPAGTAYRDLAPGQHTGSGMGYPPKNTWTTFSAPLDAASWGVSESTWNAILANVTRIQLSVEALNGPEVPGASTTSRSPAPPASRASAPRPLLEVGTAWASMHREPAWQTSRRDLR